MTIGSVQAEKNTMEWIVEAETREDLVDGHWYGGEELVRCKDCMHSGFFNGHLCCDAFADDLADIQEDDYCSKGERI